MTSVVIPCFNEERRILSTVERILAFLGGRETPWEVIVVDDGSRDRTAERVRERCADEPRLRVIRYDENHGKGWAVREGFRAATGDLVLFTDADLSTPIDEVSVFEQRAADGFDLVIASRVVEGANILTPQPLRRRLSGWVFRNLVRGLGLSTFRDTQCGFKLMRRSTMSPVLEAMTTGGFAFDVELIFRAEALGLRVCEEGVRWTDSRDSKVRLYPDAVRMAFDLVRLRRSLGSRRRQTSKR